MAASSLSEKPLNCSVFPFRSMSKLTVNSAIIPPHLSLLFFLFVLWIDKPCFIVYNKNDDNIFTVYFLSSFLSSDCDRSRFFCLLHCHNAGSLINSHTIEWFKSMYSVCVIAFSCLAMQISPYTWCASIISQLFFA